MKITVFSDYICPFCYIGVVTLKQIQPDVPPFTLEWKGFQIHPEYPAAGIPVEQRMAQIGRERYEMIWKNVSSLAETVGLTIRRPSVLTNSLMALETTEYAKEQGKGNLSHRQYTKPIFKKDENIGDLDVIRTLARENGLDSNAVATHLQERTYAPRLEAARQEARTRGVSGVPTFIIGPRRLSEPNPARHLSQCLIVLPSED